MKPLLVGMILPVALVSVLLVIALSGCTTMPPTAPAGRAAEAKVTTANAQVDLPHYSLVVPPDRGWYLRKGDERVEGIRVEQRMGPPVNATFLMQFARVDVFNERKAWSAQQVADEYRGLEKRIMIEQGVNKGQYRLGDVVMGDEQVGENRLYTMKYATSSRTQNQRAALYLYFPREENHSYFILAHYSETLTPGTAIAGALFDGIRDDFLHTLKSLRVSQ